CSRAAGRTANRRILMPNVSSNWNQGKGRRTQVDPPRVNVVSVIVFLVCFLPGLVTIFLLGNPAGLITGTLLGLLAAMAPKVAQQWERAVVLRLGNYRGLQGPGLFWVIPGIDQVTSWIDQRIITTSFAAEETLTSDTV